MTMKFKPQLGADSARTLLDGALDASRSEGLALSIAIVDEGGYLLGLQRMDGAGLMTPKIATEKARTAALIRAPSGRLGARLSEEPALLRLTDYLPLPGGLPILADGICLGGIGVSGGTAEQDERIGAAGIASLQLSST